MKRLVADCPAKVNLALRILGRRDDGYHEIETVFQAVDLWDRLEVEPANSLSLSCEDPAIPVDDTNLVLRAARSFREHTGSRAGAAFHLRKAIPVGGGMGGGSADAAGALMLLDRLWSTDSSSEAMSRVAGGLGADVPFFLRGGTAFGTGRGDRIAEMPDLGETALLLGLPPFGIPTAEVYGEMAARRPSMEGHDRLTPPGNDVSVTRFLALKLPGGNDFGFAVNDLEEAVFDRWPELKAFRDAMLKAGASRALLSGSGSTVFGIFPERGGVGQAISALEGSFPSWELRPCRTIRGGVRIRSEEGGTG